MAKIKTTNEKGEEVEIEAFTEEEVNAKIDNLKKEYDQKISEKDSSLSNLSKEKEELEKKINGVKEDNPNFKTLKDALDKKTADIESLKNEITNDRKLRKDSYINNLIMKAVKGDTEMEKKIKFHLESTLAGMKSDTDEDLKNKVDSAIKLSIDTQSNNILDNVMQNGGGKGDGGNYGGNNSQVEFSQREKSLGNKMGISEEDYKKYGNDPRLLKSLKK